MSNNQQAMSGPSNVTVLRGVVTNDPTVRELASGVVVVQFDVSTRISQYVKAVKVSVPLSWTDPSATALSPIVKGVDVVVVGSVRRRFFRSGGMTQSRTEVVIDRIVPARRTKTVRSLIGAAATSIMEYERV
jgi:single-strand DNA-binding protein